MSKMLVVDETLSPPDAAPTPGGDTDYGRPLMKPPHSAASLIAGLSLGLTKPLTWAQENFAVQTLIGRRDCGICRSEVGQMCQVYGGIPELRRTHPIRLTTTQTERRRLVARARAAKPVSRDA